MEASVRGDQDIWKHAYAASFELHFLTTDVGLAPVCSSHHFKLYDIDE